MLFDLLPEDPAGVAGARFTGVVDWAAAYIDHSPRRRHGAAVKTGEHLSTE
ncbi:hypothetical protein [Streptomyces sp. MH13]|uniref:hypothetical protein n=1 Tax=Streptomyces sp. MH13 TaxID=3417651 RepID=UPI003CEC2D53